MISSNGTVTLSFIEETYNISHDSNFSYVFDGHFYDSASPLTKQIQETSKAVYSTTRYTKSVLFILYWIISPLLNYIFFFNWFFRIRKKSQTFK